MDPWLIALGSVCGKYLPVFGMVLWSIVSTMVTDLLKPPGTITPIAKRPLLQSFAANLAVAGLSTVVALVSVDVAEGPSFARIAIYGVAIGLMVLALITIIWTESLIDERWKKGLCGSAAVLCVMMGIAASMAAARPDDLPQPVIPEPQMDRPASAERGTT